MYSVAFIFKPGNYDSEFLKLDAEIASIAENLSGFIGKESWQSADGELLNSTYYWQDEATLKVFSTHPKHIEAKKQYQRWYDGFHVVISKVERSYGDGGVGHITPNSRTR